MTDSAFYDSFETILENGLLKICRGAGLIGDTLLRSDDIDDRWEEYIKDYVADAVENFNQYPEAAISWAGFLGIGVAHCGTWTGRGTGTTPIPHSTAGADGTTWTSTCCATC